MPDTDTDGPGFSKLVSGPGIAALAVLGVAVLAAPVCSGRRLSSGR